MRHHAAHHHLRSIDGAGTQVSALNLADEFHPCQKPGTALAPPQRAPRPPIARTSPPKKSVTKIAAKKIARKEKPKSVNAKRALATFKRVYGSKERVEWVKAQPCCWCGLEGYTQNAHTEGDGGSRKADAKTIAPLCGPHPSTTPLNVLVDGCHQLYDHRDPPFDDEDVRKVVRDLALDTDRLWQRVSGGGAAE